MLRLRGENQLIENTLKIKGVTYQKEPGALALITRNFTITDPRLILDYIDERYPSPQLIKGDVENRTRLKLLADHIRNNPQAATDLAREADPFVFGDQITLIDLLVAEHGCYEPFNQFIEGVINGYLRDTSWDIASAG